MGKVKRGQRVTHIQSGRTGVVHSIYRGIVWMKDSNGSVMGYGSQFRKTNSGCGCALFLIFVFAVPSLATAWSLIA